VIARRLLALPSLAVVGIYAAVIVLPDVTEYFLTGAFRTFLNRRGP
jgi:hypothetical protein